MDASTQTDDELQTLLDSFLNGEQFAEKRILDLIWERFLQFAEWRLAAYPRLDSYSVGDVLAAVHTGMPRALAAVRPKTVAHFDRLVEQRIEWRLLDFARKSRRQADREQHFPQNTDTSLFEGHVVAPSTFDPARTRHQWWSEFQVLVAQLPEAQRNVFELLWYGEDDAGQKLTHEAVADRLGISRQAVSYHWAKACDKLGPRLKDWF